MKRRLPVFVEATALSLLCAWSAAGCLISAFSLSLSDEGPMILIWALWAVLCAVLLVRRLGSVVLLSVAMVGSAWLWYDGRFGMQLLGTLGTLAGAYDSGYGFGVPQVLQVGRTVSDFPVLVLGVAVIYAVSRTVCRQKGKLLPVFLLLLSLGACMVVTDTVPQSQYLFGLLLGVYLLLVTDNVRRENGSQAEKLTAAMVLPIALALGAVFYFCPRENYVNTTVQLRENIMAMITELPQTLQQQGSNLFSGLKSREKVNLSILPTQVLRGIPVAEVTAEQSGPVYLRAQDYDVYTGTAWESSANRQDTLAGSGGERGTVRVELLGGADYLLLPAFPDGQVFLLNGKAENEAGNASAIYDRREFSLSAYPGNQWLALPENTGVRCRQLMQSAGIDTGSVEQTVENVASFVRTSAVYDRAGTDMGAEADDFALWFLEQGERGYCVHFATAATVLLRAAGIPARYVTGYRVDAKAGEPVQVTSDNAHAWVEYYNYRTWGWYVLEATPASPEDSALPSEVPTQEQQEATQPAPQLPTQTPSAEQPSEVPPQAAEQPRRQLPAWIPLTVVFLGMLAGAAELQRIIRIRLRTNAQQKGTANQRAVACDRELRLLARLTRRRVPKELDELTEKAVFSQHTLTQEELRQYTQCQAAYRRKLRAAPWQKKMLYRYVYAVI